MVGLISFSKKIKDALIILVVGTFLGLLYPLLNGEDRLGPILNGFVIGLTGSGLIVFNEIIFNPKSLRLLKFKAVVIYKSIIYFTFFILIIPLVVSLSRAIEQGISLSEFVDNRGLYRFIFEEDFHIIVFYALVVTVLFIFTYQMSRKMGQGVMWDFLSGKYFHPREEELIFMHLDLNDSTSLAENLGDIEYNKFLKSFFFDITDSILNNYGKIYRYVGDEVVVSWKLKKGLKNTQFLNTFFEARKAIENNKEQYMDTYGVVPEFTVSFNFGKVIVGEIGEIKSQISFIGNVMYESRAIEKSCKKFNTDILISDTLLEKIELPKKYKSQKVGRIEFLENSSVSVSSLSFA